MDKEQFIETCVNSGYCTKSIANQYINENPKVSYDNSDLIAAYRFKNQWSGKHTSHLRAINEGRTTAYNHIKGNSSGSQDWID